MAIQPPFFGKRDNESAALRHAHPGPQAAAATNGSASAHPHSPQAVSALPPAHEAPAAVPLGTRAQESGSKLIVGPKIKLKGVEITDCDTLVVEGTVEATMDSRVMQISESGAFKGSAEIDIAEIHGAFDGNLTVRQKLVIHATGKVTGKIRYGKLIVEEGGQLAGEIVCGAQAGAKPTFITKPGLQVA